MFWLRNKKNYLSIIPLIWSSDNSTVDLEWLKWLNYHGFFKFGKNHIHVAADLG